MRTLFPQLAKSCEVTTLEHFINDDSWIMQQKLDGHRLFLQSPGGLDMPPAALTRNGTSYTRRLPKEITNFRFPPGDWILDGELVGHVVNGHTVSSTFWAFDLPIAGNDHTALPLYQRRAALETFLKSIGPHPFRIIPEARTRDEKIALAHRALNRGFEGLVLKRKDSPYRSAGRTEEWLKLKFVATVDVVVTDCRADGKDSVGYAIYENGTLKPIGRASLIGKEKDHVIAPGDVIEVRYLYVGADGRLYQPTIMRKRFDKRPDECTGDQLRHVNKEVLEAL